MPDERLDSMRQGISAPPESPEATRADQERRAENVRNPVEMESAMGGTSDTDRPGDEAMLDAQLARGASGDRTAPDGGDMGEDAGGARDAAGGDRTVRETREAGLRAQGGGSSDEGDIRRSAGEHDGGTAR